MHWFISSPDTNEDRTQNGEKKFIDILSLSTLSLNSILFYLDTKHDILNQYNSSEYSKQGFQRNESTF